MIWGKFSPKSMRFINTPVSQDARINILEGSVRSSKTVTMIPKWLDYIINGPRGLLLMSGKTKQTLKTNVLNDLFDTVGKSDYTYNYSSGELTIYDRKIIVKGANDQRAEEYIRGATFAGAYCDETSLYPESYFKQVLARCSVENAKIYCTTNPDSPFHFLNKDYITDKEKTGSGMFNVIHFTLDDNLNLSEEYIKFIKSSYTGLWYKRMILGLWVMADGAIYDNFNEKRHCITRYHLPTKFERIIIAADYGQGNPTVFGKIGFTGISTGKPCAWQLGEYYHDGRATGSRTTLQYKKDLIRFIGTDKIDAIIVDPSATSLITELRSTSADCAFYVRNAKNEVSAGINTVATYLEQDRYKVVANACPHTIEEFSAYIWDANAQKKGDDKPLKENDHCMDMVRYGLHTMYPVAKPERTIVKNGRAA